MVIYDCIYQLSLHIFVNHLEMCCWIWYWYWKSGHIQMLLMLPLAYMHTLGWARNGQLVSYWLYNLLHAVQITTWDPSFTCEQTQDQLTDSIKHQTCDPLISCPRYNVQVDIVKQEQTSFCHIITLKYTIPGPMHDTIL